MDIERSQKQIQPGSRTGATRRTTGGFSGHQEPVVVISRKQLDKLVPGGVKRFFDTAPDLDDLADMVAQLKSE